MKRRIGQGANLTHRKTGGAVLSDVDPDEPVVLARALEQARAEDGRDLLDAVVDLELKIWFGGGKVPLVKVLPFAFIYMRGRHPPPSTTNLGLHDGHGTPKSPVALRCRVFLDLIFTFLLEGFDRVPDGQGRGWWVETAHTQNTLLQHTEPYAHVHRRCMLC